MGPNFLEYIFFLMTNDIMQVSFWVLTFFLPNFCWVICRISTLNFFIIGTMSLFLE